MDIRFFQIAVPIICIVFIIRILLKFRESKVNIYETTLGTIFWLSGILLALFPDLISRKLARVLGFESNVNAILFFCIGVIFFLQYKSYHLIRKQNSDITSLSRQIALLEKPEKEVA